MDAVDAAGAAGSARAADAVPVPTDARCGRTIRLTVVVALAVAAGCAGLLVAGRLGTVGRLTASDCDAACAALVPDDGVPALAVPQQPRSRPAPASMATLPAAPSSAPVSASALVQFKVTSHWGDGYRADVTIADAGAVPLTDWHLTFHVTGAKLHQPTDTGETAMTGDVVTVTPATWRHPVTADAPATFGLGFDGVLAAPTDCLFDGSPCALRFVNGAG